jgi:cardiolipin-specific phospholipase
MSERQEPLASQRGETKKSGYFPLGYKDGFSQWWASISPAAAEHKVLSFIPYLQSGAPSQKATGLVGASPAKDLGVGEESEGPAGDDLSRTVTDSKETSKRDDPYGPRRWHSTLVKLSGKDRAINEFSVERVGEDVDNTIVMLHGYGAGLGFFYKNFEPLSRQPHWRLYALDMLGMGRSSRPPFKISAKDREGKIRETENWFVDALEEWRVERKIERFTLLGHSLGGYMAVCYALKYPGRLNKLILASPVGIPEDPSAANEPLPEDGGASGVDAELAQDTVESTSKDNNNFLNAKNKADAAKASSGNPNARPPQTTSRKVFSWLWDQNVSVFSFVRWSGPLGPRLVSGWTSRRFGTLPAEEASALHDYSYSLFRQRGSGEYALGYVLAPGAYARSPLIRRIGGVGRGEYNPADVGPKTAAIEGTEKVKENGIPVVFMYGSHDWMDPKGGYASVEKLKEVKERALKEYLHKGEKAPRDQSEAKVLVTDKAGHHIYLDGDDHFNEQITAEFKDTERRQGR